MDTPDVGRMTMHANESTRFIDGEAGARLEVGR
jgi:hypothetical protein